MDQPWDGSPFSGAKIALIVDNELVAYKRDMKPDIPFPGLWDLPGGGREGDESPIDCVLRETWEEFGLDVPVERIVWRRQYLREMSPGLASHFFVARIPPAMIDEIRFGDEGERWEMMTLRGFLDHPQAIPGLRKRLADYLSDVGLPPQ